MKTVRFLDTDCIVEKARYPNGRPALVLNDARDGEQVTVASVNMPEVALGPNEVLIKSYSENSGLLTVLEAAGVVKSTGETVRSGFVELHKVDLLGPYREQASQQRDEFSEQLGKVRPITRNLIDSAMEGKPVTNATIIDFGLDSDKHYEALALPIRNKEIKPLELDAAMGHGEKLTEMVRNAPSNPHKDVTFYTSWDGMAGRPKPEGAKSEESKLQRTMERLGGKGPEDYARTQRDSEKGRTR